MNPAVCDWSIIAGWRFRAICYLIALWQHIFIKWILFYKNFRNAICEIFMNFNFIEERKIWYIWSKYEACRWSIIARWRFRATRYLAALWRHNITKWILFYKNSSKKTWIIYEFSHLGISPFEIMFGHWWTTTYMP